MVPLSPTVSIVMPVYNSAAYMRYTIESVFKQTHQDWELIVVNDCSTDNSSALVEEYMQYESRISLVNLTKNMGAPAGPRNIGVEKARGKWIAFLDSDDLWHPEKLCRQISILQKTGARFCSTQMVDFIDNESPKLDDTSSNEIKWISFEQQLFKPRTPTSSVVVEKKLLLKYRFNESRAYKAREDFDCWLHCHEELGKSIKIMTPMVGYRIIKGQISGRKWDMFIRHLYVLRNYQFISGRLLSFPEALLFTLTHFVLSFYYRYSKGVL